tara:strand:+ start:63 stop:467 length:405 start_codon:yes stop_codon:yes gene_type:complete
MFNIYTPIEIAQILIALFLSSCMIQSGLDKVFDWKGNNDFLKSHFSKTFLSGMVPMLLFIVTLLELIGGFLCLGGAVMGIITFDTSLIGIGLFVIAVDLIALFFGQRIAKDYQGAATLVGYFILSILGIITFGL